MSKMFIGLKNVWYGNIITPATAGKDITAADIKSWLSASTTTKVGNVHQGTWGYSQDDPSVTEYINEITGKPYYRDPESEGNHTITFTIGVYDFEDKVALQGGSLIKSGTPETVVGWKASESPELINKGIVAQTKTGNYIVFPNAGIVGKVDTQEKNLGLGITAVAMDTEVDTIAGEYWFDGSAIK